MKDKLTAQVLEIQRTNSKELRSQLVKNLNEDATKIYSKKLRRRFTDDERQVIGVALLEAIKKYDLRKNAAFMTFADKIIIRRLIDHFRKNKAENKHLIFDEEDPTSVLNQKAINEYKNREVDEEVAYQREEELDKFKTIMKNLRYTLTDVMESRPKHQDSEQELKQLALHIVELNLGERFLTDYPPSRELLRLIGKKFDKKRRPYLCALIVALIYNFPVMRTHLGIRKEV